MQGPSFAWHLEMFVFLILVFKALTVHHHANTLFFFYCFPNSFSANKNHYYFRCNLASANHTKIPNSKFKGFSTGRFRRRMIWITAFHVLAMLISCFTSESAFATTIMPFRFVKTFNSPNLLSFDSKMVCKFAFSKKATKKFRKLQTFQQKSDSNQKRANKRNFMIQPFVLFVPSFLLFVMN